MRGCVLLLASVLVALAPATSSAQEKGALDAGLFRRSIDRNPTDADPASNPQGSLAKAPLATGYYIVDNDEPDVPAPWRPTYSFVDTTGSEARSWRRIRSGPNQVPMSTWTQPGSQGKEFFWNPNAPGDSTDNAFAGPIAIGFPFYYYGRAYDSFYVSTNGLIALTNRRYDYDESGARTGYNPFRDDTVVRPRAGSSALTDPTPDDYGWRYVALGATTSVTGGIRKPANGRLPDTTLRSVIAPLWSDQELSQYNAASGAVDDFGRVYWRRDASGDRLIIYFVNISIRGEVYVPLFDLVTTAPSRAMRSNLQVVLDRTDSSVQINYVRFAGGYVEPVGLFPWAPTPSIQRANATIGMQSNGDVPAPCASGDCPGATGVESTTYLSPDAQRRGGRVAVNGDPVRTPDAGLAIKLRQWANISRVLGVGFDTPSRTDAGTYTSLPEGMPPDNFELLLGDPVLGVIRPRGIVQNVSDSIGPVNRTPQPVSFEVIFRVRDIVNCTADLVYQRAQLTRPLHPIRVATSTAPSIDTVIFEPYVTSAQLARQAGRFRAEVITTDRSPAGTPTGETWPFDDTTGVRIFGLARRSIPFISTFSDFAMACDADVLLTTELVPNPHTWVSLGTQVVDGDQNTWNPPPPRGPSGGVGRPVLNSPVLAMDRATATGERYQPVMAFRGDTLISFPLDISSASRPVIHLSYQRSGRRVYHRGWSDRVRIGPEHAVYNVLKTGFMQIPDRLVVEFAEPSPDGIDNITNVRAWSDAGFGDTSRFPRWRAITGRSATPRWGVFGGGGGSGSDTAGRILIDELDPGKDFRFHRASIPIPARWSRDPNTNRSFRFRLMVEAAGDTGAVMPVDDMDPFYVDNITVTSLDRPELEVTTVGAHWPYTIAPASQARAIPLYATIANNGAAASTSFGVAVYVQSLTTPPRPGLYNYYRFRSVISLGAGKERTESIPTWNAQECGVAITDTTPNRLHTNHYRITAQLLPAGIDDYGANDLTHAVFTLTLGSVFAYDDTSRREGRNEVPSFSGLPGRGLDLAPPAEDPGDPNPLQPYGPLGGNYSGSFAARFTVVARDTIRGYQAYFASGNSQPDRILYSLYRAYSHQNAWPDTAVRATRVYARRGEGVPVRPPMFPEELTFDGYVTYMLPTPYLAEPGEYFVTVSQLGPTGIALGGSADRQGQVTTIVDTASTPLGLGNRSMPAHPEMLAQRFWFETRSESGTWNQMLQPTTNPGFPHLTYDGREGTGVATFSRGSWIPMIRPYFGPRSSTACTVEPVELSEFDVTSLADALRLDWSTASERDNRGFHLERRTRDGDWRAVAFVQGAGTSNREQRYGYVDVQVERETTYQYRLRQEDLDGSVSYSAVREGRIASSATTTPGTALAQNMPNPFGDETTIGYTTTGAGAVIEITDVLGSVVRRFAVSGSGSVVWDGASSDGRALPNGVYAYRLVGDGPGAARKLSLVR